VRTTRAVAIGALEATFDREEAALNPAITADHCDTINQV